MSNQTNRKSKKSWRRGIILAAGVLILVGAAAGGWGYMLWSSEPAYWRVVDESDPQVREQAAEFERETLSRLTRVRPEHHTWQMTLTQKEVSQWLATRLPRWLKNQGIDGRLLELLHHPMVAFVDGRIILAAKVVLRGMEQVVSFIYKPDDSPSGPVRLELAGMKAGRLPLPADAAKRLLAQYLSGQSEEQHKVDHIYNTLRSISLELSLSDGRHVRVTDMRVTDGQALLTFRTVWKGEDARG